MSYRHAGETLLNQRGLTLVATIPLVAGGRCSAGRSERCPKTGLSGDIASPQNAVDTLFLAIETSRPLLRGLHKSLQADKNRHNFIKPSICILMRHSFALSWLGLKMRNRFIVSTQESVGCRRPWLGLRRRGKTGDEASAGTRPHLDIFTGWSGARLSPQARQPCPLRQFCRIR